MTLSNTYITSVGSWNQLRLVWTATQSTVNNYSYVTGKLYWETKSGNGKVSASSSNAGSITIDGETSTFSATPYLLAGGSKLLHTFNKVLSHNSAGDKSFSISGSFAINAELSGVYYGTRTVSGSDDLNTIPRESSLSGGTSFTASNNTTLSVTRYSTSFSHEIDIAIARTDSVYDFIKTVSLTSSQTSVSSSFSVAQTEEIFQHLAGRTTAATRMILRTYSGGTLIGSNTYYGTVTAPHESTPSISFDRYLYTDESVSLPITRNSTGFTHTVVFRIGTFTKTYTGIGTSVTWTPTTTERNTIEGQIGSSSTSIDGTVEITTYWQSGVVRTMHSSLLQFHIRGTGSAPIFSASQIAYADSNATTSTLTGNNQYIIQDHSILRVQIVSAATPQNGATIDRYVITVAGVSKTQTTTGLNVIGTIGTTNNTTLIVKAIDSRGYSTTVSKTVLVLPYAPPAVNTSAQRQFGYESTTTMSLSGTISPIKVGIVNQNEVISAQYQYRVKGNGTYSSLINYSFTQTVPAYNATNVERLFSNTSTWEIKTIVSDYLSTTEVVDVLEVGQPLWFFDAIKKSVGFNDFPVGNNEFRLNGQLVFGANMWGANTEGGGVGGAINLNNSDIFGGNGFYFNDVSSNSGEGFNFLKTGAISGSSTYTDYDNFRVTNGVGYLNGSEVLLPQEKLWEGVSLLDDTITIYPSRYLTDCPNGWILGFSRYTSGASGETDYNYILVPKEHALTRGVWIPLVATGTGSTVPTVCYKYIYVSHNRFSGHARNGTGVESGQALRFVASF